jgi:hypothetical protein
MATYSKVLLSDSTSGKNISVTGANTGAAVDIHDAVAGASDIDEVWLYACNTSAADVVLTVEYGGTTDQDDYIETTLTADGGMTLVVPGLLLNGGLTIKAWAASANVVNINGYVNRITA